MRPTLPGADVRGFYQALNIELPSWPAVNANVRCFADPEAHHHGDRHPSTSVRLADGVWRCHGCGATGSPYHAAIARGHTPRSAFDLMIRHGLAEPSSRLCTARELIISPSEVNAHRPLARRLQATEEDVRSWQCALERRPNLAMRISGERGWAQPTMRELGLGWHRGRITIPIRDRHHHLRGVLRYQPHDTGRPKMLAVPGTRLGLIPHPATEPSHHLVLVEGPPDMIAARSRGIPAIAVPGDHAWQPEWTPLLAGRDVTVIMDSDPAGRSAAQRIRTSLVGHARTRVRDLAPGRSDGYDLTDHLLAHCLADLDQSA